MQENQSIEENKKKKMDMKKILGSISGYIKLHKLEFAAYFGFVLCLIIFSILPPIINNISIWNPGPLKAFINKVAPLLIVGIGATFIYSMGSIDISVGYQTAVYGALFVLIANATGSLILGFGAIVCIGILCAAFNASIGAYVKLPAVMSSVILMQLFSGISSLIQDKYGTTTIGLIDQSLKNSIGWAKVQTNIIIAIVVLCIIATYLLRYTKLGKRARAIGANKKAADQAGAKLLLTRMIAYAVFSVFLCFSAFVLTARIGAMPMAATENYQMDIMIMLLMGGVPLSGGMRVKLSGSIVGCLTYNLISTGMSYCNVPMGYILITQAVIFLAIVGVTCRTNGDYLPR